MNDVNPSQNVQQTATGTTQSGGDQQAGGSGSSTPQGAKTNPVVVQPTDGGSGRVVFIIRPPE